MCFTCNVTCATYHCSFFRFAEHTFFCEMFLTFGALILLGFFCWLYRKWWREEDTNPILGEQESRRLGAQGNWCRKLGIEETFFLHTAKENMYMISKALLMTSKVKLAPELFRDALDILMRRHPLLRACHMQVKGVDYLAEMKDPVVPFYVAETNDWKELLEGRTRTRYDRPCTLLWQAELIENFPQPDFTQAACPFQYALVFSFHHVIYDSTSHLRLYQELMTTVSDLKEGRMSVEQEVTSLPVPIPLSMRHPRFKDSKWRSVKAMGLGLFVYFTFKPNNPWLKVFPPPELNPRQEVITRVVPFQIDPDMTQNLVMQCKRRRVTVHAALMAVASVCVAEMLQGGQLKEDMTIQCFSTMCSKLRFPEYCRDQDVGCYASATETPVKARKDWKVNFWKTANEAFHNLHYNLKEACLESIDILSVWSWLASFGLLKPTFLDQQHGRFPAILAFTNVGNCEWLNNPLSLLRLRAMHLDLALEKCGPVLYNYLATVDNRLTWTVEYSTNIIHTPLVEEYTSKVTSTMKILFKSTE